MYITYSHHINGTRRFTIYSSNATGGPGRPVAKASAASVEAYGSRAGGVPGDRKVDLDAVEMARRMILGSQSARSLAKIRLTSKAE